MYFEPGHSDHQLPFDPPTVLFIANQRAGGGRKGWRQEWKDPRKNFSVPRQKVSVECGTR
jgi:hypothetical protein